MAYQRLSARLVSVYVFLLLFVWMAGTAVAGDESSGDSRWGLFKKNTDLLSEIEKKLISSENPLRLWEDENGSFLQAGVRAEFAYFNQSNSWFDESKNNLGKKSDTWFEQAYGFGMFGSYFLPDAGEVYGRLTGLHMRTGNNDAAGSTNGVKQDDNTRVESAYMGWRSGDLFDSLGKDFIDVSVGRRQYVAGNGFLFYAESSNGGKRGSYWIGSRHAADFLALLTLKTGGFSADIFHLKADDNPNSDTRATGVTLDYGFDTLGGIGGGVYYITSDIDARDSMEVYDARYSLTPFAGLDAEKDSFAFLKPLKFEAEYVYEDTDDGFGEGHGWYASAAYQFEKLPWQPTLTYRYASFDENYDPLFYGFNDWGYWYQGEILGEYVLSNSNLDSHMIRLSASPIESVTANFFYYHFMLHDASDYGVSNSNYADEFDLTIDWTANKHLSFSLVGAHASPNSGAKQDTGGNNGWSYMMLYTKIQF